MGLFSRKPTKEQSPACPSIDETAEFTEWMLRHHQTMEYLRKMFKPKAFEILVPGIVKDMVHTLEKYDSAEKLRDRLTLAGKLYQDMQPILKERSGDVSRCSQEIQIHYIDLISKLSILPYFLKYKYGDSWFFDNAGLKDL